MSLKTQRLLARAKKLTKKGHGKEAQSIYLKVLESFPSNQEAKKELLILNQRKETSPSQKQLDEVMQLYSSNQMQEALFTTQHLINDLAQHFKHSINLI